MKKLYTAIGDCGEGKDKSVTGEYEFTKDGDHIIYNYKGITFSINRATLKPAEKEDIETYNRKKYNHEHIANRLLQSRRKRE